MQETIGLSITPLKPQIPVGMNMGGRPTKREEINKKISESLSKQSPEVVERLRQAFAIGANVERACRYAKIHKATYYNWIRENPELLDELEGFRDQPVLKALKTVVNSLDDPNNAFKYLEKRVPEEFGAKTKIEISQPAETGPLNEKKRKNIEQFNERARQILEEEIALKELNNQPLLQ